jgi:tol-pal system protein YbgF
MTVMAQARAPERRRTGTPTLSRITLGALLGAVLGVAPAGMFAAPAAAQQDLRPLLERIQRMERDLSTLQQQVNGGRPPPSGGGAMDTEATAAATVRLSQLESDLRATTGQFEEINFSVGQLRQRLDRLVSDVDFRLQELEKVASGRAPATPPAGAAAPVAEAGSGAGAAAPTAEGRGEVRADAGAAPQALGAPPRNLGAIPATAADRPPPAGAGAAPPPPVPPQAAALGAGALPPPSGPAPNVRLPPGAPKDQYDYAFDLLKRAEYAEAEQALRQFVNAYPHDPLAGNAQYWLAETYYVRNNYSEAATQFLKGYQTYPQSPKAPDNLFKLGLTLTILGKVQEACSAFQRFDKEYPAAPGALKRRVGDERQRLGCA